MRSAVYQNTNNRYNSGTEEIRNTRKRRALSKRKARIRRRNRFITFLLSAIVCVMIVFTLLITTSVKTSADEQDIIRTKYYKSVEIEAGDSLWTIAQENISPEYKDMDDYIKEVKSINQLKGNTIYSGQYICVPYYAD